MLLPPPCTPPEHNDHDDLHRMDIDRSSSVNSTTIDDDHSLLLLHSLKQSSDANDILAILRTIKCLIIGNNRKKAMFIRRNLLEISLRIGALPDSDVRIKCEIAEIFNSLVKGGEYESNAVLYSTAVELMLEYVHIDHTLLVEAATRCLRTMFSLSPSSSSITDRRHLSRLLAIADRSLRTMQTVPAILASICRMGVESQNILLELDTFRILQRLIAVDNNNVLLPVLDCLMALTYDNAKAAEQLSNADSILLRFEHLLERHVPATVQLAAAKCLLSMCRADVIDDATDVIINKAMPTVIRCTRAKQPLELRRDAIDTLSHAIDHSRLLQRHAADNNQCLRELLRCVPKNATTLLNDELTLDDLRELEPSALNAIACLVMNDEELRQRIGGEHLCASIDRCRSKIGIDHQRHSHAIVRCLYALSRSVEQLRKTFREPAVWKLLVELARSDDEQLVEMSSAALCNVCFEFSPCKRELVDAGIIDIFLALTKRSSTNYRLTGVWGLMNLAYRADTKLKMTIIKSVGAEHLLRLVTDTNAGSPIVLRTMALIRNVLSHGSESKSPHHIDHVIVSHGNAIVQAVIYVLEEDCPLEAKEMALCILSNMAAGQNTKHLLLTNEDLMRKVTNYMRASNVCLQMAATFCIYNLVCKDDDGYEERQRTLMTMGVHRLLTQVQKTSDTELYERANRTLKEFSSTL